MTYDDWTPRYRRLIRTYNKTESVDQCSAYFEALQGYSLDVIDKAVTKTIAEEKYWPAVADIRSHALGILAGMNAPARACDLCHGSGWVDAPDEQHFNRTYTNYVRRCPQCSIFAKKPAQATL